MTVVFLVFQVRTHPNKLWVPDILLENSFGQTQVYQLDYQVYVVASYFGLLYWAIPLVVLSKCRTDVTYFPFDEQVCVIKISSWTYHDKLINFTLSQYNSGMENPISNIEWDITEVKGTFYPNAMTAPHPYYPNDVISYPYIIYQISLKRKPNFYVNLLVVPSFVISWMGAVIYLIPNSSGEKLGFSITLFLSLYVNQVIVAEHLPPSADTFPLIARFYMIISFLLAFSVLPTVVTLSFHYKLFYSVDPDDSTFPNLVNWLEKLGRCPSFWFPVCCWKTCCGTPYSRKKANSAYGQSEFKGKNMETSEYIQSSFTLVNTHYKETNKYQTNNSNNRLYQSISDSMRRMSSFPQGVNDVQKNHIENPCSVNEDFDHTSTIPADASPQLMKKDFNSSTEAAIDRILDRMQLLLSSEPDPLLTRWQVIATGVDKIGFFIYCLLLISTTTMFTIFLIFRNYPSGTE